MPSGSRGAVSHDVGEPARAAVRDPLQPPGNPPELRGDRFRVALGYPRLGRVHLAGWASARWTDCHSVAYQGFAATCGLLAVGGADWPETTS